MRHLECDTCRKIRLDCSRYYVCRRSLGGNYHMYSHSTSQLCYTRNRSFHIFARSHNQIGKFINYYHYIRQEPVPFLGIQFSFTETLVIFFYIAHSCLFQKQITSVHFLAQTVKGIDHSVNIRDDYLVIIVRNLGKKMIFQCRINAKLHFLGIYENQLQFCRMFCIKKRSNYGI